MRITLVAIALSSILLLCSCADRQPAQSVPSPENDAVAMPQKMETSPLTELMNAVKQAEGSAYGKGFPAQKAKVAETAKRILSGRRLEDFLTDPTELGNSFHKVTIRDGILVVTGHNYWWKLTPVVEDGRVREVRVQASPICLE